MSSLRMFLSDSLDRFLLIAVDHFRSTGLGDLDLESGGTDGQDFLVTRTESGFKTTFRSRNRKRSKSEHSQSMDEMEYSEKARMPPHQLYTLVDREEKYRKELDMSKMDSRNADLLWKSDQRFHDG